MTRVLMLVLMPTGDIGSYVYPGLEACRAASPARQAEHPGSALACIENSGPILESLDAVLAGARQ